VAGEAAALGELEASGLVTSGAKGARASDEGRGGGAAGFGLADFGSGGIAFSSFCSLFMVGSWTADLCPTMTGLDVAPALTFFGFVTSKTFCVCETDFLRAVFLAGFFFVLAIAIPDIV
jgi:hypothetical protein